MERKRNKSDRDMERERAAIERVIADYRHIVHFKLTFGDAIDKFGKLYATPHYKSLPYYRKCAVKAIISHLYHGPADMSIYQYLEYRMLGPDGKYYADFDTWRKLFPDGDASLISAGTHFWKGTDKFYSTVEESV